MDVFALLIVLFLRFFVISSFNEVCLVVLLDCFSCLMPVVVLGCYGDFGLLCSLVWFVGLVILGCLLLDLFIGVLSCCWCWLVCYLDVGFRMRADACC